MREIKHWQGGSPINKGVIYKIRAIIYFLSDRKILIGIGIGLIIGTAVMTGVKINNGLTKAQIEEEARAMGMEYPDNFKVIYDKGVGK